MGLCCKLPQFRGHQRSFGPFHGQPTSSSCKAFLQVVLSQVRLAMIDESATITLELREGGLIGGRSIFFRLIR